MTASAPFDRVDLVAVDERPGLGKRSRAMLIRLRFSYPLSADCHGGRNHRRAASRASQGSRERRWPRRSAAIFTTGTRGNRGFNSFIFKRFRAFAKKTGGGKKLLAENTARVSVVTSLLH